MACLCMMQATAASTSSPVFFTGEMVFPWMFEDLVALQPFKKLAIAVAEADSAGRNARACSCCHIL
jgi:hypothetical protein